MPQVRKKHRFAFQTAKTAAARIDELEKFITWWAGPRKRTYGVPQRILKKLHLPEPLRRLYAFAGRWPTRCAEGESLLSNQNHLCPAEKLSMTDDGKLVFHHDNQYNFACTTLLQGEDPPVWESTSESWEQWTQVSESLSRFLVNFCLQELLFSSPLHFSATNLKESYVERCKEKALPLWVDEQQRCSFYLLDEWLLVGQTQGTWFAASHETGIRILKEARRKDEIRQIAFPLDVKRKGKGSIDGLWERWELRLQTDGSAKVHLVGFADAAASAPSGTFDFAGIRDELIARYPEWADASTGGSFHVEATPKELFRCALGSAKQ